MSVFYVILVNSKILNKLIYLGISLIDDMNILLITKKLQRFLNVIKHVLSFNCNELFWVYKTLPYDYDGNFSNFGILIIIFY